MKLKPNKRFWIAASVLFSIPFGTAIAFGIVYLWNQPVEEVNHIQDSLPVEERLNAKEVAELVDKKRGTLVGGIGTGATIVGGIVLLVNVALAVSRLNLDKKKIEDDKKLTESRLISERFSKAIEQLGSENTHIRLGGIYSLEKIARDSPDDYWTVMEVFAAFIREESPKYQPDYGYDSRYGYEPEPEFDPSDEKVELPTVIQAVASIIARRDDHRGSFLRLIDKIRKIDLSASNLGGVRWHRVILDGADLSKGSLMDADLTFAVFTGADLSGTVMCRADLEGADLQDANLQGVDLNYARLQNANLQGADLSGADLHRADLSGADLSGADLHRADLSGADLSDAQNLSAAINLRWADLNKAILSGTILDNVDLSGADLVGAKLKGTNLTSVNLRGAQLREASLRGAVLTSVDLCGITLKKADLTEADLSKADLSEANLFQAKLEKANLHRTNLREAKNLTKEQIEEGLLCRTRLPEGINLNPDRDCEILESPRK